MNLSKRLKWLKDRGCFPSIYLRGDSWRAHVNAGGNFWAEGKSAFAALEAAVKLWEKAKRPMDGRAVYPTSLKYN